MKKEFCIIPSSEYWTNERSGNLERHEAIFGVNRKKSIEDGLVVFLTPELHRGTNGVHGKNGHELDMMIKRAAEKSWIEYHGKTKEDFIKRYGRNYL